MDLKVEKPAQSDGVLSRVLNACLEAKANAESREKPMGHEIEGLEKLQL